MSRGPVSTGAPCAARMPGTGRAVCRGQGANTVVKDATVAVTPAPALGSGSQSFPGL